MCVFVARGETAESRSVVSSGDDDATGGRVFVPPSIELAGLGVVAVYTVGWVGE